jgi:hypothetical protein
MLLAALPWTYWLALPLVAASVAVLVVFALVYLKKVVEPHVLYMDYLNYLAASGASPAYGPAGGQPAVAAQVAGQSRSPSALAGGQSSGGAR